MKKNIICTSILALICLLAFSGLAAAMKIDGPIVMQGKNKSPLPKRAAAAENQRKRRRYGIS